MTQSLTFSIRGAMKSKETELPSQPSHQWVAESNKHNCRTTLDYNKVSSSSPIIGDKANFLYRLLEFGQNKKVPLSLPKTDINCEVIYDDTIAVLNSTVINRQDSESNDVNHFIANELLNTTKTFIETEIMSDGNSNGERIVQYSDGLVQDGERNMEETHVEPAEVCIQVEGVMNTSITVNKKSLDPKQNETLENKKEVKLEIECRDIPNYVTKHDDKCSHLEYKRTPSNREVPPRKVSFKVRSSSSCTSSRRSKMVESRVTLTSNTVAALTTKFNALISDNDTSKNAKVTRTESSECKTVLMIPQCKKPTEIKVILSRKNSSGKKDLALTKINSSNSKGTTTLKRQTVPSIVQSDETTRSTSRDAKRKISITYRPSILGTRSGNVKAAIQIFEQNATLIKTKSTEKQLAIQGKSIGHSDNLPKINDVHMLSVERNPHLTCQQKSPLIKDEVNTNQHSTEIDLANTKNDNQCLEERDLINTKYHDEHLSTSYNSDNKLHENAATECECSPSNKARLDFLKVIVSDISETKSDHDHLDPRQMADDKALSVFGNSHLTEFQPEIGILKPEEITFKNIHKDGSVVDISDCCNDIKVDNEEVEINRKGYIIGNVMPDSEVLNFIMLPITIDNNISTDKDKTMDGKDITNEAIGDVSASEGTVKSVEDVEDVEDVDTTRIFEDEVVILINPVTNKIADKQTIVEEGHYKVLVDTMKPNSSFLWRSSTQSPPSQPPPLPPKKPQIIPVEMTRHFRVAPPPPPKTKPLQNELLEEDIYDDIHPPSMIYSTGSGPGHSYSTVDEDGYDDVGGNAEDGPAALEDVYELCGVPVYEACEANYQSIGGGQSQAGEEDIYDDVKLVMTPTISDETKSISNCYESIYNAVGARKVPARCNGSSASSSSRSTNNNSSSCDQSNSLYGVGGSMSQASTVSADNAPHEVLSYQLTWLSPRSETSDEWMDVELSESEAEHGQRRTILVVQERPRSRRSPGWSRKVRKQWSKSPRKQSGNNTEIYVSSSSVLYLGAPAPEPRYAAGPLWPWVPGPVPLRAILYIGDTQESQEVSFLLEKEGGDSSDSDDHHYEMLEEVIVQGTNNDINPYDDFDSFDSEDSEEPYKKSSNQDGLEPRLTRLPEPPPGQNIYGITKIAEAAGKKMLKLRKSLSRIRPKRNNVGRDINLTANPPAVPTTPRPPSLPTVTSPLLQQPPPLPTIEKATSASNLLGRKYWTLGFKRSPSTTSGAQFCPPTASPKTSTFYLTDPIDVDAEVVENGLPSNRQSLLDSPLENGTASTSASSTSSTKTVTSESNVENCTADNARHRPRTVSAPDRRNSGTVRPNSPPPLPPTATDTPKRPNRKEKKVSNSSWYTECGLFDRTEAQNTNNSDSSKKLLSPVKSNKPVSNCWYAEVGLWDMSVTSSPNDSSLLEQDTGHQTDISDSYTSQENTAVVQRRFQDEPLYQFYTASVVEMAQWGINNEFDSDGYEEIGDQSCKTPVRPSAMELIRPRDGQYRTLWCEIPEVVNSRVLSTLSIHQKKLQEAKFEIITSEASYINSLNVLEHHFMASPELTDETILSKNDRRILFGNVIPVKICSEKFLAELEECWQDNILLHGICEAIFKHATNYFNIYIKYCSNQIYLDRTLRRLKDQHGRFADVLTQLEANPHCQLLSLHSFLMLPMQRVTRLPLLIDAVLTRLDPQDEEYRTCELALATLNKIVQDCNEGARRMERMEEILILSRQLDFPREVRAVPIISSSRWLVKCGELTQLVWRGDDAKLTFGKKFSKASLHIFLFTDLLIITKKRSDECYTVVDYCPRNLVQMMSTEGMSHLPVKLTADGGRNLMLLTMLQNHEKKTVEMMLSCSLESDRQRWLEAVSQPTSDNPEETVYEEWDCPQVTAVHSYTAHQPDELSLDISDVVNVLRKMSDGWYQGERIRDGERGWFPGNYTVEIASAHVRARNLKQRYRLLALSANFLDSQRKDKHTK